MTMGTGLLFQFPIGLVAGLSNIVALAALALLYIVTLTFYRLTLHPLAKFPGPRLAAVTSWYEAYYEIILEGQYSNKIGKLHDKYGPIIRVTPHEIHIRDSRFFEEFYTKSLLLDKHGWDKRFGCENGLLTTVDAGVHRKRRAAISHMFSRRSIVNFIHIINRHVDTFATRIKGFEGGKEPLNLTLAFPALTGDIIMDYFFGFNYEQLKNPNFESFHDAFMKVAGSGHVATQFPVIFPIMNALPDFITTFLQPAAAPLLKFKRDTQVTISRSLSGDTVQTNDAKRTIFQEILSSSLPSSDKSPSRLADEAQIIIGGGVETTAFALNIAAYHIINTPRIYDRLHADLLTTFPEKTELDLIKLESIPYLRACILEATRMSYGLSARNPRTFKEPLNYKHHSIPAGTIIAMTISNVSHDEEIFPDSRTYIPERWLDSPKTSDGIPLERFMVSFGRGGRSCLGINLAWAELYLTLGMMFRRFEWEVVEGGKRDVEMGHDFFIPVIAAGAEGVRVRTWEVEK
ncbi:cytochrome P450 [Dendryphion nanum]|uniref:Cytochrome P450 n=1 Tax=Dendryphion nanum TaxID=256645 RepID=A0A9P9D566_9PLEO|nr:cytochrome P450 [Dendryphion nanum]